MVRVAPLASAALLSLASIEVVFAKSQHHFRDPSSFLDTCIQIAASISNDSFVYYSRESSIWTPRSGLTEFTYTAQPRHSISQTMRTGPQRARGNPHAALSQAPLRTSLSSYVSFPHSHSFTFSPFPSISQCTRLTLSHTLNVVTPCWCSTHALCRKGWGPLHQSWFFVYNGSADLHDPI